MVFECPEWVANYVGVPYVPKGFDLETGVDCWGLVYHVLRREDVLDVPNYVDLYELEAKNADVEGVASSPSWVEVGFDARSPGSVLWFRSLRGVAHVGVMVSRMHFLHCNIGTAAVVARVEDRFWQARLLGVYDFAGPRLAARELAAC